MMNLHAVVRGAIPALHPDETVTLRQSTGQTNVRGRMVPVYGPAQTVSAQIQSLGSDDLQHSEAVNLTQRDRKAYLFAPDPKLPPNGIVRPLARAGDMIQRSDGFWWLVTAMLEDFTASGWVCVGITEQEKGPDLSASPDDPAEDPAEDPSERLPEVSR
ncbi:MAG: hypothetical protein J1E80_07995 [Desulfovibrionaceae bacterium]|nr:hypothetical protein [Desulfovibrionaceae bacterium]